MKSSGSAASLHFMSSPVSAIGGSDGQPRGDLLGDLFAADSPLTALATDFKANLDVGDRCVLESIDAYPQMMNSKG
jgi:hypothetical protein